MVVIGRRTRAAPPALPPWWGADEEPPRPRRRSPASSGPPPAAADAEAAAPDSAEWGDEVAYVDSSEQSAPYVAYEPEFHEPGYDDGYSDQDFPDEHRPVNGATAFYREGPTQPTMPRQDHSELTVTFPAPQQGTNAASEIPQSPLPSGRWVTQDSTDQDLYLPSGRASDDARAARTTVDRPVEALRPVGVDEARQLAECFALDYLSCDEDDPDRRRLALEPYLARRSDALLGWPGDKPGKGRWRAVQARAGEVLPYSHGITVDVKVLVEVFERTAEPEPVADSAADVEDHDAEHDSGGDDESPAGPSPPRPELPLGARWSAVPAASAPG
ncbi:hypothetical protein SAMN05216207_11502, partial [Pseudonocardia ammonioxydans]